MDPEHDQLLWMYETMLVIREFEERMVNIYLEGKLPPAIQHGLAFDIAGGPVPGEMHLAAGQEPVAVGVCAHLRDEDSVVGTHRPHHFAIAKGVPLDKLAAELFGKATGLSRGKGGHMHLFDPEHNFSCSGIEGASLPPATGAALAAKKLRRDSVAVAFFGEGAANQGTFHEALNLAGLWKLPVVFICEDNKWAISVPKAKSTAIASNADRAAAYGMPGVSVEHNDALEVFGAAGDAVSRARRGEGPTLIEVQTDRYLGHFQRPIAELMFVDFFGVCMDQIYNHLAKNTYMSDGNLRLPVVITTAIGGGYGDAAQHSQCLYATFAHMPGLKVVVPSNAYDAKGLMVQAIRDDNPVMFFFHKGIMGLPWMSYFEGSTTRVPDEAYAIEFGKATVVRQGNDVTIVTLSQMVQKALIAAEELEREGVSVEALLDAWLVEEGDWVRDGQPVADAIVVKTSFQVSAPCDGTIIEIVVAQEETFAAGAVLATLDQRAATTEAGPAELP